MLEQHTYTSRVDKFMLLSKSEITGAYCKEHSNAPQWKHNPLSTLIKQALYIRYIHVSIDSGHGKS